MVELFNLDNPILWFQVLYGTLLCLPFRLLHIQAKQTELIEYRLLKYVFLGLMLNIFSLILASIFRWIIFYQLAYLSILGWNFLIYYFTLTIRYEKPPKKVVIIGSIIPLLLGLLIFFWEPITDPDYYTFFGLIIEPSAWLKFPYRIGVRIGDNFILYSTAHRLIEQIYRIFVSAFIVVIFLVEEVDDKIKNIKLSRIKYMWIIVWSINLIYLILSLLSIYIVEEANITLFLRISVILLFCSVALFAYISVKYPEGLLFSRSQLLRAKLFYSKIENHLFTTIEKQTNKLIAYIKSLPPDIFSEDN